MSPLPPEHDGGSVSEPEVSAYIIGRNCEGTLSAALASVYAQTHPVDEVVYLDDGSTDFSLEVASTFLDRGLRILRNATSQGIPAARNRAVAATRGRWIAVLDADDVWHPDKIAMQIARLRQNTQLALIGCFARVIDERGSVWGVISAPRSDSEIKKVELTRNCFIHSSAIIRRDVFDAVGGYSDFPAAQDYDLMLKCSEEAQVENLPMVLVDYRIGSESISVRRRRTQRKYTRKAQRNALERRGRTREPREAFASAVHQLVLGIVLFDPRVHWGVHQMLCGDPAKGRRLIRLARGSGWRAYLTSTLLLAVPDGAYKAVARLRLVS